MMLSVGDDRSFEFAGRVRFATSQAENSGQKDDEDEAHD